MHSTELVTSLYLGHCKLRTIPIRGRDISISVSVPALRRVGAPAVLAFSAVAADIIVSCSQDCLGLRGIDISSSPRLLNWAVKTYGAPRTISSDPWLIQMLARVSILCNNY